MDNRAIGVFDSGLGGLTAVKELQKVLPNEHILFLGDTARVPYGTHDRETICRYTEDDIAFLLKKDVKLLIAACGTVSSNYSKERAESLPVPFFGIIEPAAKAAVRATKNGVIGVLGTQATIASGSLEKELKKLSPDLTIVSKACPMFVPLVENGYTSPDNYLTLHVADEYMGPIREAGCDTLILGCTHFPILEKVLRKCLPEDITLINSGKEIADHAAQVIRENNFENNVSSGKTDFFVTDRPHNFSTLATLFLGEDISNNVTKISLNDEG
ncbi:MAG: glutamate racemase [Oscillospiraceae bacterium]|nr:glutamate racemase [Oscillospiraceae bacterium]